MEYSIREATTKRIVNLIIEIRKFEFPFASEKNVNVSVGFWMPSILHSLLCLSLHFIPEKLFVRRLLSSIV